MSDNLENIKFAIITASSTRSIAEDTAGQALSDIITREKGVMCGHIVVKDDVEEIANAIVAASEHTELSEHSEGGVDIVLTCGGTGLSLADVTPEATAVACQRNVPGIAEAMRAKSLAVTERAMLSRAVCMQRGSTLVINLPGSKKAAVECFDAIREQLKHAVAMTAGQGH